MDLGNYNYPPFYSASLFSQLGITYTREDVDRGQAHGHVRRRGLRVHRAA